MPADAPIGWYRYEVFRLNPHAELVPLAQEDGAFAGVLLRQAFDGSAVGRHSTRERCGLGS